MGLDGVREAAGAQKASGKKVQFTALMHHITPQLLVDSFMHLKKSAAAGVDGVTWHDYEEALAERIGKLWEAVQSGRYRALPSRRVYIPKANGKQRPLGIAALEDKIVQQAVVTVLTPIYEAEFLGFSYGFRPGRSQHQALDALWVGLHWKRVNWVLDADIRLFFDTVDHEWMMRFLGHRVADRRILRLIRKWLMAGVVENGTKTEVWRGTPQGAVVTPRTQKVTSTAGRAGSAARSCRAAMRRRDRPDGDAMPDDDRVVADEDVLDDEAHDSLPLEDVERVGGAAQATEEGRERLSKAQERGAIGSLVGDGLQLGAQRLLALAQQRHALA